MFVFHACTPCNFMPVLNAQLTSVCALTSICGCLWVKRTLTPYYRRCTFQWRLVPDIKPPNAIYNRIPGAKVDGQGVVYRAWWWRTSLRMTSAFVCFLLLNRVKKETFLFVANFKVAFKWMYNAATGIFLLLHWCKRHTHRTTQTALKRT